jgi:hypothetical protein
MRRRLLIGGSVSVLLAIAAFVAGQLISRPVTDGNSMFGSLSIGLKRAAELPAQEPTTIGIVVRREDNALFIGTNIVKFDTVRDAGGRITDRRIAYDGPVIEIVVTHDTAVYRDVTEIDRHSEARQIQQVIKPGQLDEIGANAALQVWGERQGDRLVARVIVYSYLQS